MDNLDNIILLSNASGVAYNEVKDALNEEAAAVDSSEKITSKDIVHLEEKQDLKLEQLRTELSGELKNINTEINGKINTLTAQIDGQFNSQNEKIERLFTQQKLDMAKERKENIKWFIGTAAGIVGAIAGLLALYN